MMTTATNWEKAIRIKNEMLCEKDAKIKRLRVDVNRLRQEIADLKEFAYERAPKIAAQEANRQIAPLKEEIERLRHALNQIASVSTDGFMTAKTFQAWAQNRARHALGLKPGELTIRKS